MRFKSVIVVALTVFLMAAVGAASRTADVVEAGAEATQPEVASPPQSPFPDISIPGIPPAGQCCTWQVEKRIDGRRKADFGARYQCDTGVTTRGDLSLSVKIKSARLPCDQQDIIPDGSTLTAKGRVIRRADAFGHFIGEFEIANPSGAVLFKGYIETIDRIGSHHLFFNCEKCNPLSHFEGWLVGRGSNLLPNHSLRALLVARGTLPRNASQSMAVAGSLNGIFVKCP